MAGRNSVARLSSLRSDAVIVRAGRHSTHAQWVADGQHRFDLIVAAYEDLAPELTDFASASYLIPGRKVAGWRSLFRQHPDLLSRYAQIALIDDDITCTGSQLQQCFDIGRERRLQLWQPSLSWDSYFSHAVCLRNPLFKFRYVNFVEMMCPFFSAAHLQRTLPLFDWGLETGVDRLWCKLSTEPFKAYAVIDEVVVKHGRPVGKQATAQGFGDDRNPYFAPLKAFEDQSGVRFRGPVAYRGVLTNGREICGRLPMAALSLATLAARPTRVNEDWFYKPILDHCRHILTRPIDNDLLDLDVRGRLTESQTSSHGAHQ